MRSLACAVWACPLALGALACSSGSGVSVTLAPSFDFPRGVLDTIQTLTVTVYDGTSADCDMTTGKATGVTMQTPVVTPATALGTTCAAGVRFCGTLNVTESPTARVFAAVGKDPNQVEVADGCVKQVVNQDAVSMTIVMHRNLAQSVCGNGTVDPTEQCDPAGGSGDLICDSMCHTKEEYLSVPGTMQPSTTAGMPGDKTLPKFVWPAGAGNLGRFMAIWEDHSNQEVPSHAHLGMRLMTNALAAVDVVDLAPTQTEAARASFFIPNDNVTMPQPFPPVPDSFDQAAPSAVIMGGKYWIVYQDDDEVPALGQPAMHAYDIHMRSMDATSLVPDQGKDSPIGINGANGAGEPGQQITPSVAVGPNNNLYITWLSAGFDATTGQFSPGQIFGVLYDTTTHKVGAQTPISNGPSDQQPVVTGTPTGWVVAWASGTAIRMRTIAADGASAADVVVSDTRQHPGLQDHPAIASLGDGSFAIVWVDNGAPGATTSNIIYQRFTSMGTPVGGDQANPVNTMQMGKQLQPTLASSAASGGIFATAWLDASANQIRARYFSLSGGFLFNNTDGSDADFQASITAGHRRKNPTIAVGGAGQYVAIGWEDLDPSQPGIYARRFPVPPQ